MSSAADLYQDQTVRTASPPVQDDNIGNPAPLDLSTNAPLPTASTTVRNVRFSDDVLTMPQIVFLEPPGWFLFLYF